MTAFIDVLCTKPITHGEATQVARATILFMMEDSRDHESLARELNNGTLRTEYARPFNDYRPGAVPRFLGSVLMWFGNTVYGKAPSYAKFKAIEVIARIPYQSWEVAAYTLLSAFYGNEKRAIALSKVSAFARLAQDNETMHVVVMTSIARRHNCIGIFRHTLIPLVFAFFYFWAVYLLYLFSRKAGLELNYLFENHAYEQYSAFLEEHRERLMHTPLISPFLAFYGREVKNEYEFFELVRNDDLIHRNRSIREIEVT